MAQHGIEEPLVRCFSGHVCGHDRLIMLYGVESDRLPSTKAGIVSVLRCPQGRAGRELVYVDVLVDLLFIIHDRQYQLLV